MCERTFRGLHRSPVNYPRKDQWSGALMFPLIYAWTSDSANNRDAGDSRRFRAHYDGTVMQYHKWDLAVFRELTSLAKEDYDLLRRYCYKHFRFYSATSKKQEIHGKWGIPNVDFKWQNVIKLLHVITYMMMLHEIPLCPPAAALGCLCTRWPSSWYNVRNFIWGRVTHVSVGNLTNTGLNNGLSPVRRQAIIWTNAGILLIEPLGTNFGENSIEILAFLFHKMCLKVSSGNWRPCCLGLNVLNQISLNIVCP